jgi:hypothetical protein
MLKSRLFLAVGIVVVARLAIATFVTPNLLG